MRRWTVALALAATSIVACKRPKPTAFDKVWLTLDRGCAHARTGQLVCWGGPSKAAPHWSRPDEAIADASPPPAPPLLADVLEVAAGKAHTCARTARGVFCWGANGDGQLGDGTTVDHPTPTQVHGIDDASGLALGARHTCVRRANRTITCWGANDVNQLADGTTVARARPLAVFGLVGVDQVVAAGDATCALLGDGSIRCWGANDNAQLGDGTTQPRNVPSPIKSFLGPPPP